MTNQTLKVLFLLGAGIRADKCKFNHVRQQRMEEGDGLAALESFSTSFLTIPAPSSRVCNAAIQLKQGAGRQATEKVG
jgi:hypothetical protein